MAQFFKPQKKSTQPQRIEFTVDSLDHHCVGVGRHQGKAIFVEGALPGEAIKARIIDDKKHYAHAALQQVVTPAANRVAPSATTIASVAVAVPSTWEREISWRPRRRDWSACSSALATSRRLRWHLR